MSESGGARPRSSGASSSLRVHHSEFPVLRHGLPEMTLGSAGAGRAALHMAPGPGRDCRAGKTQVGTERLQARDRRMTVISVTRMKALSRRFPAATACRRRRGGSDRGLRRLSQPFRKFAGPQRRAVRSGASSSAAARPASSAVALTVRHTSLGTNITNGQGFTLYASNRTRAPRAAGSGPRASAWPPVTTSGAPSSRSRTGRQVPDRGDEAGKSHPPGHLLRASAVPLPGRQPPRRPKGQGSTVLGARWDVLSPSGQEVKAG